MYEMPSFQNVLHTNSLKLTIIEGPYSCSFRFKPTQSMQAETPNSPLRDPVRGPLLQFFSRNRGIHHLMCLLHQLAVQLQQGRLGSSAVAASANRWRAAVPKGCLVAGRSMKHTRSLSLYIYIYILSVYIYIYVCVCPCI